MSGQILVVDDLLLSRMVLRVKLTAACYETALAATGAEGLRLAHERLPDLVLLDCNLPDIHGIDVCRQLRAHPKTRHIPVILFSADQSRAMRLRALGAGADDFLSKPIDETFLLSRIRALLRQSAAERDTHLQASPTLRLGMAEAAAEFHGPARIALLCGTTRQPGPARKTASPSLPPDLFDMQLCLPDLLGPEPAARVPDMLVLSPEVLVQHGLHLVAELRARQATCQMPIAAFLSEGSPISPSMVLDLGAEEVMRLPVDTEEYRLRTAAMMRRKHRRDAHRRALGAELHLASRDALTGLYNRRHAMSRLSDMLLAPPRSGPRSFGILMIDLDNFKRINDNFGHVSGDEVLSEVGKRMRDVIGAGDVLARYGGEEFILIMPGASIQQTRAKAEAIRTQIEGDPFHLSQGGYQIDVTASIGITVQTRKAIDRTRTTLEQIRTMIDQADSALRVAKATGRNRVSGGKSAVA